MKTFLSTAAVAALAAFAFAGTASAGCVEEDSCMSTLTIGGLAGFAGEWQAAFQGDEGEAGGAKSGYGNIDITMIGSGDGCGPECSDFAWTLDAGAGEHVSAFSFGSTTVSGDTAAGLNMGTALATISAEIGKIGSGE